MKWQRLFLLVLLAALSGCADRTVQEHTTPAQQPATARAPATAPVVGPASAPAPASAPVVVSPPSFDRPLYFASDVMPVLDRLGCSAAECHGGSAGKGGLKLSLFGTSPEVDHAALVKDANHTWIRPGNQSVSLLPRVLVTKPPHREHLKLSEGSYEVRLLTSWIVQGANLKDDKAPSLKSIELSPPRLVLPKGQAQSIRVKAIFSDGSSRDVTYDARCSGLDSHVVKVQPPSLVTAQDYGDSALIVNYLRHSAAGRVLVPHPTRPDYSSFKPFNKVDELVLARLAELNIEPSELCTDAEFLRRVYLDALGVLPTAEEARAFAADGNPDKRAKMIDRLLQRPEFADCWALKWGDLLRIKSEYPVNLWPNAVQTYSHWVRDCIVRNMPYDQFARELVTATGSNFRSPPANYYRAVAKKDAQTLAESTALLFMGVRLECARCHGHPQEHWTPRDNMAMSAFFAQVKYKPTQEWKEEIVYLDSQQLLRDPATKKPAMPKFLDGKEVNPARQRDLRVALATWLTSPENPWFARNIVNRIWFWLMGRGIINPVDDIRLTNPPSNPQLLAFLEKELVSHHYDLRHIYRLVLTSRTYQVSWRSRPSNASDLTHFSHRLPQRLDAEKLLDAIGQVTETSEPFASSIPEPYTVLPEGFRAGQIFDGSINNPFLELFGRSTRDTAYESQRDNQPSMRQAMHLLNSVQIEGRLGRSPRLQRLMKIPNSQVVDELYWAALSRAPTVSEKQTAQAYLEKNKAKRLQAMQDLLWAIFNSKEFLFN